MDYLTNIFVWYIYFLQLNYFCFSDQMKKKKSKII